MTCPIRLSLVGKQWNAEHGKDYDGAAWYRTTFSSPALPPGKLAKLLFGAEDESFKLWINGRIVGERPFLAEHFGLNRPPVRRLESRLLI